MSARAPTLLRLVAGRILAFALAAMLAEAAVVFVEYWFDDDGLSRRLLERETDALTAGLGVEDGRPVYRLPETLADRYRPRVAASTGAVDEADADEDAFDTDEITAGYYARVRTREGVVLFTTCGTECTEHFLPLGLDPPAFWLRAIRPGKPLSFSGGRTVGVPGGETVHLELAVVGDPDGLVWAVLSHEMVDHLVVPMTLMLTLVIGATIGSVRQALGPVRAAAGAADAIDARDPRARLPTGGMPREVAHLATAVNRALDRVGELVRVQRLFASAIAHEIRTPVAIARMEIERIDHPRAAKALADLDGLTHVLEQLTALARLEAAEVDGLAPVDLARLAEDCVATLAPYVYGSGRTIAFAERGADPVRAAPALVEILARNLVENAVRHTPAGTAILVSAGPGPVLAVEDDGPGLSASPASADTEAGTLKRAGGIGIGLRIVERIAGLHRARVERGPGEGGRGARVRIVFPPADDPGAPAVTA